MATCIRSIAQVLVVVATCPGGAAEADGGSWREVARMHARRGAHGMVTLNDGRAMAISGFGDDVGHYNAEIFDPRGGRDAAGDWTTTPTIGGEQPWGSNVPLTVVLRDGRVLATGGITAVSDFPFFGGTPPDLRAFLYNPHTNAWTQTGSLPVGIGSGVGGNAVLLRNGDILIAGGYGTNANHDLIANDVGLIYSVRRGTWDFTRDLTRADRPPTRMPRGMTHNRLATMADGRVLCIGGGRDNGSDADPINAVIFDPATGKWTPALEQMPEIPREEINPPGLGGGRQWPVVVPFKNGMVLVAGGVTLNDQPTAENPWDPNPNAYSRTSALLFDSRSERWEVLADSLAVSHAFSDTNLQVDGATALLLPAAGDFPFLCGVGSVDTESFDLPSRTFSQLAPLPSTDIPGFCDPSVPLPTISPGYGAATLLVDRRGLMAGGVIDFLDPTWNVSDRAFLFTP